MLRDHAMPVAVTAVTSPPAREDQSIFGGRLFDCGDQSQGQALASANGASMASCSLAADPPVVAAFALLT